MQRDRKGNCQSSPGLRSRAGTGTPSSAPMQTTLDTPTLITVVASLPRRWPGPAPTDACATRPRAKTRHRVTTLQTLCPPQDLCTPHSFCSPLSSWPLPPVVFVMCFYLLSVSTLDSKMLRTKIAAALFNTAPIPFRAVGAG